MAKIPTGRFVWFEYASNDARKAQAFYGELFGWKTKDMEGTPGGGHYTMIVAGGEEIGGYWPPPPEGVPAHWMSHLQVESAADSAAKVKSLGGSVKMEPMTVGDAGTFAVVSDPTGAVFSLWQPDKHLGVADYKGKPGTFVWNELYTSDPAKAVAFYKGLAGFEEQKMEMGGDTGTYHVLNFEERGRAGVLKSPMPQIPPNWLPYVQVEDADRVAERAKKLGGDVVVPPTDVPDVGRFAVLKDNQGAAIGILKPSPRPSK